MQSDLMESERETMAGCCGVDVSFLRSVVNQRRTERLNEMKPKYEAIVIIIKSNQIKIKERQRERERERKRSDQINPGEEKKERIAADGGKNGASPLMPME